jgi:hypothetical protein
VKRGWERSWYFREDLSRLPEVVASPEVGENEGESKAERGEEKSGKKDGVLPMFHTDFFLFGEWNPFLFRRDGRGTCYLYW